ncbi:hypothetical protein ET445_08150 [Agromyces protaetiae]|uniref:Multidrug ABC transporter ATPase n=1 Tax=Agromyces protaetiae TaxID=2509455 RepID=A0A4P6FFW2_9MICO|nr:hypothetical protein [Agromyces protaetiae]QAY73319.1 hypothetical protein ET445_08150 [Agromyces protaetiae]
MSTDRPAAESRVIRVLAYMVAGIVLAAVAAFIAVIIGTFANAGTEHWAEQGVWPIVLVFPLIALPIGILLIIAIMILSAVRRSRQAREKSS